MHKKLKIKLKDLKSLPIEFKVLAILNTAVVYSGFNSRALLNCARASSCFPELLRLIPLLVNAS